MTKKLQPEFRLKFWKWKSYWHFPEEFDEKFYKICDRFEDNLWSIQMMLELIDLAHSYGAKFVRDIDNSPMSYEWARLYVQEYLTTGGDLDKNYNF